MRQDTNKRKAKARVRQEQEVAVLALSLELQQTNDGRFFHEHQIIAQSLKPGVSVGARVPTSLERFDLMSERGVL